MINNDDVGLLQFTLISIIEVHNCSELTINLGLTLVENSFLISPIGNDTSRVLK